MLETTRDQFEDFIGCERRRFVGQDDNRVAFSLCQVARYLRFMTIQQKRCRDSGNLLVRKSRERLQNLIPGTRELTDDEMAEHRVDAELQNLLHCDTESFFLFAKIFLDKLAHFIEDFFGPVRGVSFRSHGGWCKGVEKFSQTKGIQMPAEMLDVMNRLDTSVADYRDKQVTHFQNPRALHYTTFTADGTTQIGTTTMYPKDTDKSTSSPTIDSVSGDITIYVNQLVSLIKENRGQSRYQLAADTTTRPPISSPMQQTTVRFSPSAARDQR